MSSGRISGSLCSLIAAMRSVMAEYPPGVRRNASSLRPLRPLVDFGLVLMGMVPFS